MPSNSKPSTKSAGAAATKLRAQGKLSTLAPSGKTRDSSQTMRIVLGVLLLLNLIAAGLVLYPPGGTAEGLEQQLASLQTQVSQARAQVEQTRTHAAAVQMGRSDGDAFLDEYFVENRVLSSTLVEELTTAASRAGITPRGNAYVTDLIEGSDRLGMMTITSNYEGTYTQLLNLIREVDRSPSLLILESLTAAPQSDNNLLQISLRMNAFVQEDPNAFPQVPPEEVAAASGTEAEVAP